MKRISLCVLVAGCAVASSFGVVVGTYASASPLGIERAFWCGFSVTGKSFPSAPAPGMAILVR